MPVFSNQLNDAIASLLARGKIGVFRSDTLYGIFACASDQQAVERIYVVKGRTPTKSPIVLISSMKQLFDEYDEKTIARLDELWPGKNSVVLPSMAAPHWLTRGNESVAYRMPDDEKLRAFLEKTGPLIAPSANPEGQPPAMNITESKAYFGDKIDFYVDGGEVTDDSPSKLYRLQPDGLERLR